jgi:hypothetical protein
MVADFARLRIPDSGDQHDDLTHQKFQSFRLLGIPQPAADSALGRACRPEAGRDWMPSQEVDVSNRAGTVHV